MKAWSYSTLEKFETCPRQYYELKVARNFVDPPTVHTQWGKDVHAALECRIKDGTPLPEGMQQWEGIAAKVAALPGEKFTELQVALDRNFKPTEWDAAWTRGVIDVAIVNGDRAVVLDWKTGKAKYTEQLDLYAGYLFAVHPDVAQVDTAFVWLKSRKLHKKSIDRTEMSSIWQGMCSRVARLESAHERNSWPERPSGLCNGWCPVSTCSYNKKVKT